MCNTSDQRNHHPYSRREVFGDVSGGGPLQHEDAEGVDCHAKGTEINGIGANEFQIPLSATESILGNVLTPSYQILLHANRTKDEPHQEPSAASLKHRPRAVVRLPAG